MARRAFTIFSTAHRSLLPRRSMTKMRHRGNVPQMSVSSTTSSKSKQVRIQRTFLGLKLVTWVQITLASVVFARFTWNILWMHTHWVTQTLSLSPVSRRSFIVADDPLDTIEQLPPASSSSASTTIVIPAEERAIMDERRRRRIERSRPPVTASSLSILQSTMESERGTITITTEFDWQGLCQRASVDSSSRVAISGLLSRPPAKALAFALKQQCGLKSLLGIDLLFPNTQKSRLDFMEDYRLLRRSIDVVSLHIPSFDPSINDDTFKVITDYEPTHIFHFETTPVDKESVMTDSNERMYNIKSSLRILNEILRAVVSMEKHPRTVMISDYEANKKANVRLAKVLESAYEGMFHLPLVRLELPRVYGPLVTSLGSEEKDLFLIDRLKTKEISTMYVDEAVASILTVLDPSLENDSFVASSEVTVSKSWAQLNDTYTEFNKIMDFRASETNAWLYAKWYDHLGNANYPGEYLDLYGVYRTVFPCISKCERAAECAPSVFDSIQQLSQEVTQSCDYVVYTMEFRAKFDGFDAEPSDDPAYEVDMCRVAYISGNSKLVRDQLTLKYPDQEITTSMLEEENGKLVVYGWRLIWLIGVDDTTMDLKDIALLIVDPSGLFSSHVRKVMYADNYAFMKASNAQLEGTFGEMDRERIGRRTKKVKMPGSNIRKLVVLHRERARKVIFYSKQPKRKYLPTSVRDFAKKAETPVAPRYVDFVEETSRIIMSREGRSKTEQKAEVYDEFPFQWFDDSVFIHDLDMKFSQDFRCAWYKEYSEYGGGYDGYRLAFAYLIGKRRLQGRLGQRLEDDRSWMPVMKQDDLDSREKNKAGSEVFLRIVER